MNTLLCFGLGYSAEALAHRLGAKGGWRIIGTSRSQQGVDAITAKGFTGLAFDGQTPSSELLAAMAVATHVLISAPPGLTGDPVLSSCGPQIARAGKGCWVGYLSTIGVYGDSGGGWIDEETPPRPTHERAQRRLAAEMAWLDFGARHGVHVEIFRIAGIYGPGRSVVDDLGAGTARRIVKPGQVFNRIHVEDIARALEAAIAAGKPGRVYNLTDDEPASGETVLLYAAALLGMTPPPPTPFHAASMSPMAASFYADNRRVRNHRIKTECGVVLRFPTYREGLTALAAGAVTKAKS